MAIKDEKRTDTNILEVTKTDQYNTVEELFKKSQPGSVYYTLLVLSVFIVASGLLLNNAAIVIGGMLVAPLLTPVLVVGLGFAVGQMCAVKGVLPLMLKSFAIIVTLSILISFLFGEQKDGMLALENTLRIGLLYFVAALSAGAAATFAWARKEVAEILPGIAIAVSLVPPLSLVGIRLSVFDFSAARFYSLVFFFNLLGIIVGSIVVFSLLKFYRTGKKVERETHDAGEAAKDSKPK